MPTCYSCHSKNVTELLDLGLQPVSNRFLKAREEGEETYALVMNQCRDCGLVQINKPASVGQLQPSFDWITYSEPEGHLDRLVETIKNLPGITVNSSFCGISFKDDSTLTRLQKLGFSKTHRLDLKDDLNIDYKGAGAESIQAYLTPERARGIIQKLGKFDVIIVRHILEHAHDPAAFIQALKNLISKNGYIIFEVPDCSRALENCDYTTIWEEHTLYFTPVTFQNSLRLMGMTVHSYECYPYPFENCLMSIVSVDQQAKLSRPSKEVLDRELARASRFAGCLPKVAAALRKYFKEYRENHGKIALFGAGHLACTFVSVLGLKDHIDFLVDDNKNKWGLFMPGCRLPIYESAALRRGDVSLCLLSFNPLVEKKVLQDYRDWKGTFASIFPSSSIALKVPEMGDHAVRKTACRLCGSKDLVLGASLAPTPLGESYTVSPSVKADQRTIPLDLVLCPTCGNIQLGHVIDLEEWYGHYISRARYSIEMPQPFSGGQVFGEDRKMPPEHTVLVESAVRQEKDFWGPAKAQKCREMTGGDSHITAISVMANVDDMEEFVNGVKIAIGRKGTFVFETGYGLDLLEKNLVDVVHHDHLSYFTFTALEQFFQRHSLRITDVVRTDAKGGSLRCVVHVNNSPVPVSPSVQQMLDEEKPKIARGIGLFRDFNLFIERTKERLADTLDKIIREGKTVAAYGASVGSTTLIYTFGLGGKLSCIFDDDPRRSNLFSPGYSIPVYLSSEIEKYRPDYIVILAWRYEREIMQKNAGYQDSEGRFITFMPEINLGKRKLTNAV